MRWLKNKSSSGTVGNAFCVVLGVICAFMGLPLEFALGIVLVGTIIEWATDRGK